MRLAIVGSRTFEDKDFMWRCLEEVKADLAQNYKEIDLIVSGGAGGADSLAQVYAREFAIPILIFYPDWKQYGKAAGPKRNQQIVDNCDIVVAFPVGDARGTNDTLNKAHKVNRKTYIFTQKGII